MSQAWAFPHLHFTPCTRQGREKPAPPPGLWVLCLCLYLPTAAGEDASVDVFAAVVPTFPPSRHVPSV